MFDHNMQKNLWPTCCLLPWSPLLAAFGNTLEPLSSWHACDEEVWSVGIIEESNPVQLSRRLYRAMGR